jgi:hypothetical protein
MNKRFYNIGIFFVILISLAISIFVLTGRAKAESQYRTVLIAIDYFQLHRFARYNGTDIDTLLDQLKTDGFDTIALIEDTPEFLEERGIASVVKGFNVEKKVLEGPESTKNKEKPEITNVTEDKLTAEYLGLPPNQVHVLFNDPTMSLRFQQAWARRIGENRVKLTSFADQNVWAVSLDGDPEEMYQLGAGFITDTAGFLKMKGFKILPRFRNCRDIIPSVVFEDLNQKYIGLEPNIPIIFDGDEVLGYPSALKETASALKAGGFQFGYIEFARQEGERQLAKLSLPNVVRIHSISDEEMEIYNPAKALARYLRAVRERNVRVVYLKPFFLHGQGEDAIKLNIDYFKSVKDSLIKDGLTIGIPKPISDKAEGNISFPFKALLLLSIGASLLLLFSLGWGIRSYIITALVVLGALYAATNVQASMAIKAFGMLAGITFPSLGLVWVFNSWKLKGRFPSPLTSFLRMILFTLTGGMIVASLFQAPAYNLEIDSYSGVKLTFILPIFITAIVGVRLFFREQSAGFLSELGFLGDMEIKIKHLALLVIVGFAGLILLTRSGNEPIFAVSDVENSVRGLMEAFFSVRPRTKEFLIGHPLMITGLYFLYKDHFKFKSLAFLAIVGGMIGQVSVFNTFCHFHTPLGISILRTIYGLVVGAVLGILLAAVISLLLKFILRPAQK